MDQEKAWLCDTIITCVPQIYKTSELNGNVMGMSWMPDSLGALRLQEFITTNKVKDSTPPNPPNDLKISVESLDKYKTSNV